MKKSLLIYCLLALNTSKAQITVTIKPDANHSKDALVISPCVSSNYCTINYGNNVHLITAAWTWGGEPGVVHTLIDFDWSLLPQGAIVQDAQLKLFAFNGQGGSQEFHSELSGSNETWIERITSPWDESTVTYNTEPSATTLNRVSVYSSDSINQDFEMNVTPLLNDILADPANSFGFRMILQNENYYRRLGFCSSDNEDPGKWPQITITFDAPGVSGVVYNDIDGDCQRDANELGLQGRLVEIQPGGIIAMTNEIGIWHADLPVGNYTATLLNPGAGWTTSCSTQESIVVTDPNAPVYVPDFGLNSTVNCSSPNIAIYSNIIRRCFSEQEIYVHAENDFLATAPINNAYAEIELDPLFTLDSASIPFTNMGGGMYHFDLGTLQPAQGVDFTLYVTLSCDAELLQTLCYEANLYPVEPCVMDTIPAPPGDGVTPCELPWDHSSLSVDGWCDGDSVYFTITNTGQFGDGDMDCFSPVRVYVDGQLILLDSVQLLGGETVTFVFAGTAQTWILEADQHPLHPGNSHPNAHVENCGTGIWTPDLINDFPQDDADPVVDIFCSVTNGAYDPNDKRGFPSGVTDNHYIKPNQELEYIIRFQNTGTDTAFTVIVRDTLDTDLDLSSVRTGNTSHDYEFNIIGNRVLEWKFDNILLVDSTTNEPGSHGFIQFTVKQNPDLVEGTEINNSVAIYFDFNDAVITNTTSHIIQPNAYLELESVTTGDLKVKVYPNPFTGQLFIATEQMEQSCRYTLRDITGKVVLSGKTDPLTMLSVDQLKSGVFVLVVENEQSKSVYKLIKH